MSVNLYLVRHALKKKEIGDVPITPEGRKQAQDTAQYFSTIPVTAIVSSPLRRAQETAAAIAERTNATVNIDARLRERANWGDVPDQTFQEFVELWDRCTRDPDFVPPVGDSAKVACDRMSSLLADLVQEYPAGSHIVIVTHGGLITDYLANTYAEETLNRFHPQFKIEQSQIVSECSITKLSYENENYTIEYFASVEHLKSGR
ncbi:histidine phosphatase family protein [Paenibacillus sp. 598K]|uniref:histidine phosphatase family protein n=1 Tax=Paenibacillus sp. 598K TaxID=1117987 RepID=UPI000FFA2DBA|nr:histidine phosphatase family protein [Paenibacillus sp. 598K]GBF75530.1 histidine phosphatase family protein [Paenibacillus sp. 598K]